MNNARLQHYVPQFLLRRFTDADGALAVFDKSSDRSFTTGTRALAEAERVGARRAVVLVHEFVTPATSADRLESNALDLKRFLQRLSGNPEDSIGPGCLRGPLRVPGRQAEPTIGLYLGKAFRNTRFASLRCDA